jgi:phospholipid/cholesterol/gamma-HCH transport system permease protein
LSEQMSEARGLLNELIGFVDYAIQVLLALPSVLFRHPLRVLRQFNRCLWAGLPLVMVAGVSIGLVGWFQLRRLLETYHARDVLPGALAASVLVEIGPMLASLLLAARLGAGMAAELGTMRLTEEIDALQILGSPPIPTLVAPRVLAALMAGPLAAVVLDFSALFAGLVAEQVAGWLAPEVFLVRALDGLWLRDLVPSTLKTACFGALVGLVGCWCGLNVGRSAEGVGRAATLGVVGSALSVFVANAVLVPVLQGLVDLWRVHV